MLLSILIPTIPDRKALFTELYSDLAYQIHNIPHGDDLVEILDDDSNLIIGAKRNNLLQRASGEFVVFIDDDDKVHYKYVQLILDAILENPGIDCVGMKGIISFDGNSPKPWSISMHHKSWYEANDTYYRTPNHIAPVRASIAKAVGFPEKSHGEDYEYSMGILPMLKSEHFINEEMYHYRFMSK